MCSAKENAMKFRRAIIGAFVAVAALSLSACGGEGGYDSYDMSQGAPESIPMEAGMDQEVKIQDSAIIRTGNATIRVDSVDSSLTSIISLTSDYEGVVQSQDRSDAEGVDYANVTIRIPADRFDEFVDQLAEIGDVEYLNINAMDVTTQVRDIDARVLALQTSIERLKDLQSQAGTVTDLVAIESELTTRQAELDSLLSQQNYLKDQVAMSTLTVNIVPSSETALSLPDVGGAFTSGVQGLLNFVGFLVSAAVFLLPLALVTLLIVATIKWAIRRRRARSSQ
jgi:Domain of unknown function (DUF4349)